VPCDRSRAGDADHIDGKRHIPLPRAAELLADDAPEDRGNGAVKEVGDREGHRDGNDQGRREQGKEHLSTIACTARAAQENATKRSDQQGLSASAARDAHPTTGAGRRR
jgi:hypothetical protein